MRLGFVLLSCLALGEGDRLLKTGDVAGAIAVYEQEASEHPDDARRALRLARALLMDDRPGDALPWAQLGASARGGDVVYLEALLRTGDFEAVLAQTQDGPLRGEALLAAGDLDGAAVLVRDPELVEWVAARQGRLQSASTASASWLLGTEASTPVLGDPAKWMDEARARAEAGDTENAARLALRALTLDRSVATSVFAVEQLLRLDADAGRVLAFAQGQASTDDDHRQLALLEARTAPDAHAEVAALERAAAFGPVDGPLLFSLAMAYEDAGRRPEAARAAVEAADRGHPDARAYVAAAYERAGRPQLAARYR